MLLPLTVLAGAMLSVQARVNGALADRLGSAVLTALVSFSVGTAALAVTVATTGRWRALALLRRGGGPGATVDPRDRSAFPRQSGRTVDPAYGEPPNSREGRRDDDPSGRDVDPRWWWFCGGLGGAFLVATSALAVPRTGVALLAVGIVAGQTLGSLAVDRAGLSPRGHQPITLPRVAGVGFAIAALAIGATGERLDPRLGILALTAVAGAGVAAQQAANGNLQRLTGEALVAALISFTVGTVALGAGTAALAVTGRLDAVEWPGPGGVYLGGLCGATYITLSAAAVARLGVLRLTLASVAGQLVGAVVLDVVRPAHEGLRAATVVATALTFLAVAVSGRGSQRPTRTT